MAALACATAGCPADDTPPEQTTTASSSSTTDPTPISATSTALPMTSTTSGSTSTDTGPSADSTSTGEPPETSSSSGTDSGTSDSGDTTGTDTGDSGSDSSGGNTLACETNCVVEFMCSDAWMSEQECVAACEANLDKASSFNRFCHYAWQELHLCIGMLSCVEYDEYQAAAVFPYPCWQEVESLALECAGQ